jgi:hypothetical protein
VNATFGDTDDRAPGGAASAITSITVKKGLDNATIFEAGLFGKAKTPKSVTPSLDPHFRILPAS